METFLSFLEEFRIHFRGADAVDIVLMSAVVYGGLIWFRHAASRRVLIGVIVVLVIYFLARTLDMFLVSLVLQAGFAVLIIILVVIFQEDLRRMFERIAGARWLGRIDRTAPELPLDLDVLVEAAFVMAESRTGALIVLQGAEPLDRHIDGGVSIDGLISRPLLFSIFDSSSPGHDGAIVIDKGRIERFAAHLPISKNHKVIAGRGTRHSAALGVAECSDAMAIVVSEESGTVSVAEARRLTAIDSPSVLKQRMVSFLEEKFPANQTNGVRQLLLRNGWLKLLALVLTVSAWFVLAYNPDSVQRTFVVPIEYRNLPKGHVLDEWTPTEARMTLSASERSLRFLEPGSLKISINLDEARPGFQEIAIAERHVRLPQNMTIYRIDPRVVRINVQAEPVEQPSDSAP